MERQRWVVVGALTALLTVLLLFDAWDCLVGSNTYEVPAELYTLMAAIVAGLFTDEAIRRLRGNGKNGHGTDSGGSGNKPQEG